MNKLAIKSTFPVIFLTIYLLLTVVIIAGCEGPEGPPGVGIEDVDLIRPEVELLHPQANDTITAAYMTCEATASDNDSIFYVEFYINGSSYLGGDSFAVAFESPYSVTWNFYGSETESGLLNFVARAVDLSGNYTDTPVIPLWYQPQFGVVELAYDNTSGLPAALPLPDDSGDRYFNVRFSPRAQCTLTALRFQFLDPQANGFADGVDFNIFIWNSEDRLPSTVVDSFFVADTSITSYDTWIEFDLTDIDNLEFDSDFHAGWSPVAALYEEYFDSFRAGLLKVTNSEDFPLKDGSMHRSIEFEGGGSGRGWGTVQDHWNIRLDFHIRAVVDYGDGEVSLLVPNNNSQGF